MIIFFLHIEDMKTVGGWGPGIFLLLHYYVLNGAQCVAGRLDFL